MVYRATRTAGGAGSTASVRNAPAHSRSQTRIDDHEFPEAAQLQAAGRSSARRLHAPQLIAEPSTATLDPPLRRTERPIRSQSTQASLPSSSRSYRVLFAVVVKRLSRG